MPTRNRSGLVLAAFIKYVRQMLNATGEEDTDYDGPFSHPGEFHAFFIGIGVMATVLTTGNVALLSGVLTLIFTGNRARLRVSRQVRMELRREPWYALGGMTGTLIVLGLAAVFGVVALDLPEQIGA